MKTRKYIYRNAPTFVIAAAALIISGCSDHTANNAEDTHHQPIVTYQQPGQIGQVDESTGSTTIQTHQTTQKVGTESIPTIEQTYHKADINRLSSSEFQKLGLSKDASDAVVKYRKDHGKFTSVDGLNQVPGMNTAWVDDMKDKLGVENKKEG